MTLPGGLVPANVKGWFASRLDPGAADGAAVVTLPDVSGNGFNIPQSIASRRYIHRANHYGALSAWQAEANGVSGYQRAWGATITEPYTIFRVVEITGPMNTDYCISSGFSKSQKHMVGISGGTRYVMEQEGIGQHIYGGVPQSNQLVVLRAEYASTDKLFVNGVQVMPANSNAGDDASIGCTIGCRENWQRGIVGFDCEYGFALGVGLVGVEAELLSIYG